MTQLYAQQVLFVNYIVDVHVSITFIMKATKGIMLQCDVALKTWLIYQDSQLTGINKFIIADIDQTHLFIKGMWCYQRKYIHYTLTLIVFDVKYRQ